MGGRFCIPPRMAFKIETYGRGSQRQKLTDIYVQLANQSFLPLRELARHYGLQGEKPFATGNHLEQINGCGAMAERWVKNLGQMTGRDDLHRYTLLPCRGVFARMSSIVSERRRWCPLCLYEDVEFGGQSYERLIWAMEVVRVCPIHHITLEDTCRTCRTRCRMEMGPRQISGMCAGCGGWLGREFVDLDVKESDPKYLFEIWIAEGVAEFFDLTDAKMAKLKVENIALMIRAGIKAIAGGKAAQFGVVCGKRKSVISGWQSGKVVPSMRALAFLSWRFGVPLCAWLTGRTDAWEAARLRTVPYGLALSGTRRRPRKVNVEQLAQYLKTEIKKKAPARCFVEVARGLSYDPSFLRQKFPDLASAISKRYQDERRLEIASRHQRNKELIKSTAAEVVNLLKGAGKAPNRRIVVAMMIERGVPVRYADYPLLAAAMGKKRSR